MPPSNDQDGPPPTRRPNFDRKPNRTIQVPPEFRPEVFGGSLKALVNDWKVETGCDVVHYLDIHQKLRHFDIFSSGGGNVDAAVRAVNKWISHANTKTAASTSWSRMPAFDPNKWYYEKVDEMEVERKNMFKGPAPKDNHPEFKIVVDWPAKLGAMKTFPTDIFGTKLEALDSIRKDDEVFISLLPHQNPPSKVVIEGYEMECVINAEQHYLNLAQKVLMNKLREFNSASVNIVLDQDEGDKVVINQTEDWWPVTKDLAIPRLLVSLMDEPGRFRRAGLPPKQLRRIQEEIRSVLDTIRFDRGFYDFTIRFGCVALSGLTKKDMEKQYPVKAFLKNIDSRPLCQVKHWAFDFFSGQKLLGRMMATPDVLAPVKIGEGMYGFTPSTLEETRPVYHSTWVLHDPNAPMSKRNRGRLAHQGIDQVMNLSLVVVQVEWTEDEEGVYEKMPARFYKLKHGTAAPVEHLDVKLFELGESRAWRFAIEKMMAVPASTLSPVIANFVDSIKMKSAKEVESNPCGGFAQWKLTPSVKLHTGRLDKVYTFGLRNTHYLVEVLEMWSPAQKPPCWGVVVRHKDWSTHLNQLERLPQGGAGYFGADSIETFLPGNGRTSNDNLEQNLGKMTLNGDSESGDSDVAGIKLLISKLMRLSEIIIASGATN
ncbi:hypothetical protein CC78DRAFT_566447 [Lojkania enalia]|uniref:DUF7905 domain-containing protein n=1 Tax=Lojkania enalia TaxID=147567 RepID=A0A9P4KG22_9PLEO|nr:hypothetical protein CC78DRAFT_566447 [Didymosphaeria enalia]